MSAIGCWTSTSTHFDLKRFAKEGVLRFLVGNKCDLEHKRVVSYEQGKELAKQYGIPFLETSAKDTVNIDELFLSITKNFLDKQAANVSQKDSRKERNIKNNKTISVDKINEVHKKKNCC